MRNAMLILALMTSPLSAFAATETSKDLATLGRTTWSAFACSSLASESNNSNEQERLFKLGYKQGGRFIAALKSGKIKKADLDTSVPVTVLMLLEGPTPDFMLGRIYEAAQESALKDVYKDDDHKASKELRALAAGNKFASGNCELIGK